MQSWNTRPSGHRKFVYENSSECARNARDRGRYARDVIIKYAPPSWTRNRWPSRSKDWLPTLGQRSRADLADAQIKYTARSSIAIKLPISMKYTYSRLTTPCTCTMLVISNITLV